MNTKKNAKRQRLFSTLLILCLLLLGNAGAEALDADALNALPDFGQQPVADDAVLALGDQAVVSDEVLPGAVVEAPYEGLEVYFLDLGRVDAILIRCGGESCFIDVGFKEDARPAIRFLQAMGISHLNSYVGTHGHADHIEGAPEIIAAFRPDSLYLSHTAALSALLDCADAAQKETIAATEKVILQPGDVFNIGQATMTTLGPLEIRNVNTGRTIENDNSLIQRLDYGHRSFLFTGDTSNRVLRAVNQQFPGRLDVDVLKNPHHNGAHDEDVIDMISPAITVFCTDNQFQPTKKYQSLLTSKGSRVYITGSRNQGNVAIVSDGPKLEVRCGYSVQSIAMEPVPRLYVGQEYALKTSVEPAGVLNSAANLGWNSSNEAVVQVYNGRLRAVGEGTATVSAVAINGVSASVEVESRLAYVELDQSDMQLAVGQTRKLTGKITPSNPKGVSGQWLSEDEGVATVSGGKVTGVSEGVTRVIARLSNGAEAACTVTVQGRAAKSVKLNTRKARMKVGDNLTLTATVEPADFDMNSLVWYSSDESVLWVDQMGNITAVRAGKAKIAAVASEGVYDVCTIRVE